MVFSARLSGNDTTRIREYAHHWNAYLPESRSFSRLCYESRGRARFAKYLDILSRVGPL